MTAIELDGQPHEVPDHCTLADLVERLGHAPRAVCTAVDGVFVARERRADVLLHDGAKVLLFVPIVGG